MLAPSIVFVDLETTGANPAFDRIIEVGIVKVTGGQVEYEWSTLVDPGESIPPLIQGFTGISNEMVRGAPAFREIADEVFARIEGSLFVAHNARFDYGLATAPTSTPSSTSSSSSLPPRPTPTSAWC